MIETEIRAKLENLKNFLGVYARDELRRFFEVYPQSLVVNTDKRIDPGQHWVCIFINKNGKGEYFDAYGLPPLREEFINYLENNTTNGFWFNKRTLQCNECITCGHWCCVYILFRSAGISYNKFIRIFSGNLELNDIIIKNLFEEIDRRKSKKWILNKIQHLESRVFSKMKSN